MLEEAPAASGQYVEFRCRCHDCCASWLVNSTSIVMSIKSATTTLPAPKTRSMSIPNAARLMVVVAVNPARWPPDGSSTVPWYSAVSSTVRVMPWKVSSPSTVKEFPSPVRTRVEVNSMLG